MNATGGGNNDTLYARRSSSVLTCSSSTAICHLLLSSYYVAFPPPHHHHHPAAPPPPAGPRYCCYYYCRVVIVITRHGRRRVRASRSSTAHDARPRANPDHRPSYSYTRRNRTTTRYNERSSGWRSSPTPVHQLLQRLFVCQQTWGPATQRGQQIPQTESFNRAQPSSSLRQP